MARPRKDRPAPTDFVVDQVSDIAKVFDGEASKLETLAKYANAKVKEKCLYKADVFRDCARLARQITVSRVPVNATT